ncbi:peptidase M42 [Caldicellulosiruptoraceae bacterium PP1]
MIESFPGREQELKYYVEDELSSINVFYDDDKIGNTFGERGKNPCIVFNAHYDSIGKENVGKNWMFEINYDHKKDIIKSNGIRPIGGDDRCGIAIILALLRFTDFPFKFIITTYCEDEHQGIKYFLQNQQKFFNGTKLCIGLDRKGYGDIIVSYAGKDICVKEEYIDKVKNAAKSIGIYTKREKSPNIADVRIIYDKLGINCLNLSVGYYNAHSESEYIILDNVVKTYYWVCQILEQC